MGIKRDFSTTAVRLAYTFDQNDIGDFFRDLENGHIYQCIGAGAGAAYTKNVTSDKVGYIYLSLNSFREMSSGGDVGDTSANGGVLASDTTPILLGDAAESQVLSWPSSNNDIVGCSVLLPPDLDDTRDVSVDLMTSSGGTTNAASFTVETGWDSGTIVADTATGAASTTPGVITATVAAADVPASPRALTLMLTPTAHTTDAKLLHGGVCIRYFKK